MENQKALKREDVKKVKILENNEPLVEIFETEKISLLSEHKFLYPFLRKTTLEKLIGASRNLPDQYKLLVVTAYRSFEMQKDLHSQRSWQMAKKYPFLMIFWHKKWKSFVMKYTAPPGGSPHQCGGAVDIALIDKNGNRLDMGTSLTDFGEKVHTNSHLITNEQKANRKILYEAMIKAGFTNYPLEWWHFDYGDNMWAAYSGLDNCMYGPLNK